MAEKKMVNFLEETLEFLKDGDYEEDWMCGKVTCVSIRKDNIKYYMSFEQFKKLAAEFNYDMYCTNLGKIPALTLRIWFEDGSCLGRINIKSEILFKHDPWNPYDPDNIPKNGWELLNYTLGDEYYYTAAPALFDPTITDPKALIYQKYNSEEIYTL